MNGLRVRMMSAGDGRWREGWSGATQVEGHTPPLAALPQTMSEHEATAPIQVGGGGWRWQRLRSVAIVMSTEGGDGECEYSDSGGNDVGDHDRTDIDLELGASDLGCGH